MSLKPDWNEIALSIEQNSQVANVDDQWEIECRKWLASVISEFGDTYQIHESKNFLIVSNENDRYIRVFKDFLERTLKRIQASLKSVVPSEGHGRFVVFIFQDMEQYYEYISLFLPEDGEFGLSSGMHINDGYGHFVFPSQDISYAEPIAVHELTHACLTHLPIPLWLNEGLAVLMEDVLAGVRPFLNAELISRHQVYWNEQTIQKFWSGESFSAIDEGQELSYNLAYILVSNLSQDYGKFAKFCNGAHFENSGELASIEHLGLSLEQLVSLFLGEGNWKPVSRQLPDKGTFDR